MYNKKLAKCLSSFFTLSEISVLCEWHEVWLRMLFLTSARERKIEKERKNKIL